MLAVKLLTSKEIVVNRKVNTKPKTHVFKQVISNVIDLSNIKTISITVNK